MRPHLLLSLALICVTSCRSATTGTPASDAAPRPTASAALQISADSLYATVRARLERRGHRIEEADAARRRLVVRAPKGDTRVLVRIVPAGDSSTISVTPLGQVGLTDGLRAMLTVTHDATMDTSAAVAPAELEGLPKSRWRPELFLSPAGRLWLASGGLYSADSLGGRWRRALGGANDPVTPDELRIGVEMAFVDERIALLGLPDNRNPGKSLLYRTTNAGESWLPVDAVPNVVAIDALEAIDNSVWALATRWENDARRAVFFRSDDGGATWRQSELPATLNDVTGLYRLSASTAYVSTSRSRTTKAPVFWRTTDGGTTWSPVETPHDQRVHEVPSYGVRIEEIATAGDWLLVREYGKVFVTRSDSIAWRRSDELEYIAADRARDGIFALTESLQAVMLDRDLRVLWRTQERVQKTDPPDVEKLVATDGVGYVSMGHGQIYEARDGTLRLVKPVGSR